VGWLIFYMSSIFLGKTVLKMLGLYLYTLVIGHKSCNRLSILNKLTLQKELQNVWQIMCFGAKSKNSTTIQKIKPNIPCRSRELNRDLLHPKRMRYHCTLSQLRVAIVVKLFNCFDAMGWNVNKQSRICGPHIFNKFIFSVIF